jgi:hypothetical protein
VFRLAVRCRLHTLAVFAATALAFLLATAVPSARAHDSLAPRGSNHAWLPHEHWVHGHWLPYDEARLRDLLKVDDEAVFRWLKDDHRTLAGLARRQGVDPHGLAERLLAGRRDEVPATVYAQLRRRTQRMLTQGHLAQHVYYHVFHGPRLVTDFRRWFGVRRAVYERLRYKKGLSPRAIAQRHGRDPAAVREHARAALRAEAEEGVHHEATSRLQATAMLARQERVLQCWIDRPAPKFDRTNPFGDPNGGHGRHRRSSRVGIKHPKPARGCWRGLYSR